jgi:3-methyladenine DNA glycosylase AlkD
MRYVFRPVNRPSSVSSAVRALDARLRAAAKPARAVSERAYLKSDLVFYGSGQRAIRATVRDFSRESAGLTVARLRALVRALWATESYELRGAGIALLERHVALLTRADCALIERLLRRSATWAHVDWLSTAVLAPLVLRNPPLVQTMRRWAADRSFWIRRTALLSLLPELRAGRGDFALFTELATPMLGEREFFIRKVIGWILRERSKRRFAEVRTYVRRNRARMSGLTLREATKHL